MRAAWPAAALLIGLTASAQNVVQKVTTPATANPAGAAQPQDGTRFIEACQQNIERGQLNPNCQSAFYSGEINRLKADALRTNNPALLTLLGDAYQSNHAGFADVGQAYRWYLLAAVRGDPRAMQKLSELYKDGRGTPQDNIRAMGYARLARTLAAPGSATSKQAGEVIQALGQQMAIEEVGLANAFAKELQAQLTHKTTVGATPAGSEPDKPAAPVNPANGLRPIPGASALMEAPNAAPRPTAPALPPTLRQIPGSDVLHLPPATP